MTFRESAFYPPILALALSCVVLGCADETRPPLIVSDIDIKEQLPGQRMSAGYLTLTNTTNEDIVISRVSSADYQSVEVHESSVENGVARMRPVTELVITANSALELRPGGMHLMLMNANGTEDVSLNFFDGPTLLLTVSSNVARERKQ